jgi:AAA-ATPase Vps4-associated protein 1
MHLTDPGFASPVSESSGSNGGARKPGLSPEEIAKVKQDWEDLQRRKKEKEEASKKEKDDKQKTENWKAEGKEDKETGKHAPKVPGAWTPASSTSPPTPTHQRFTLHRDIFALRLSDHRKRRQAAQAKLLAPRLPGAPQGGFT